MRSKWLHIVLIAVLLLAAVPITSAQEGKCNLAYLFNGWARATAEGAPNGAAFGLLVNLAGEDDTLVSASSAAAEAVELHEMVIGDGDVMQMRPVEGGFPVAAGGFLELKPGGLHIMLIGLKAPLLAGEMLPLTLNFETAGEVELSVPIRDMEAMGEAMESAAPMEATAEVMPIDWGEDCAGIHVVSAWARPAAPGAPNSAAYGLVLNLTSSDNALVGVESAVAEAVELHEMVMAAGDVMQMRPVEGGGIPLPAGGAALLQPGGLHIMLINLTGTLGEGDSFALDFEFADGEPVTLTIPVRQPAEPMMPAGGMD